MIGLKRVALLLVAYSLTRFLFLYWNWNLYSSVENLKLVKAFVHGLRFDLAAICLTNGPVVLLWMLPTSWYRFRALRVFELVVFAVVNFVGLGSNIADAEFVKFIGKRSAYDILLIRQDLGQQGLSVLSTYWYFLLSTILLVALVVWLAPRFYASMKSGESWAWAMATRIFAVGLIVTGARGGYQFKPLHPMHAYFSTEHELGLLTLNTPFNVIRSRPKSQIERQKFFDDEKAVEKTLRQIGELSREPLNQAPNFNVVIILVESLATEYMGAGNDFTGYTPFLDSLTREPGAYYFKHNIANSRRSIEGLPAVVCGLPAIMAEPIITSDFSNNRYECLPHVLGRRGYQTFFLHGAHNGSMHFDTFSNIAGFENFVGLNEYPKDRPGDLDNYWGVLDEPMLQYAAQVLDKARRPALVTVFTLSSHHPYYIPPEHVGRFPKGPLEIHESIGYADYSIQKFFETAKSKPWFNNTIFVITGDHTQKFFHKQYGNLIGYYRVPLIIYAPGLASRLPYDAERITQHIDVLPTLYDMMGLRLRSRLLVGQSVFDLKVEGRAYNFNSPEYFYVDKNLFLNMTRSGTIRNVKKNLGGYNLMDQPVNDEDLTSAERILKSAVHYLNEGLIRNSLYSWRPSP